MAPPLPHNIIFGGPTFLLLSVLVVMSSSQHLICDQRRIEGHSPVKQGGDGGFQIVVLGPLASKGMYAPNEVYTVTIQGLKTRYSTQKLTEFLLVSESEKQVMVGPSGLVTTGLFHIMDDAQTRYSDVCPDGVTSINRQPKTDVSVLWTAPSKLVASCVTFKATVVERPHVWFMDDGQLTLTLCPQQPEAPATDPPPTSAPAPLAPSQSAPRRLGVTTAPPPTLNEGSGSTRSDDKNICCACDDAKYDVVFEGIWSKETHPKDFPDNEWLLHFSDIIGASHSPNLVVWEDGVPASQGMRQVAEWGSTRQLETELKSQAPNINTIIKARGLWHPNEKGSSTAAFRVDKSHHLVSLVSMLGPSPDWIVGVSAFQLCLPNCTWLEETTIDLFPYDAGTDSGITYMSPNTPTQPPAPITKLTPTQPNDPRSPFHGLTELAPFAKLILRRQRIYPRACSDNATSSTLILTENSQDDIERPECAVLEWTPWSECSVRCGKGLKMRKRNYVLPDKADMFRCDRQLVEKEMCLGTMGTCPPDEVEEELGICGVTPWSEWSPCSVTCGEGVRLRSRRYKNHMGRKKCSQELSQSETCRGARTVCAIPPSATAANTTASRAFPAVAECPMSPWSEWSPCSVSCGRGIKLRSRIVLQPLSDEGPLPLPLSCSSVELREAESCLGEYGGGSCVLSEDDATQICALSHEQGPCRHYQNRFYFHQEQGRCLEFTYGGCKGNRNRFETEAECNQVCGFLANRRRNDEAISVVLTSTPVTAILSTLSTTRRPIRTRPPTPTPSSPTPPSTLATTTPAQPFTTRGAYFVGWTTRPTTTTLRTTTPTPIIVETHVDPQRHGNGGGGSSGIFYESEESFNLDLGAVTETAPEPLRALKLNLDIDDPQEESDRVDCVVSSWSEWSPCSVSCGVGIRTRVRAVLIEPSQDGRRCPRKLAKRKNCTMPPC